MKQFLTLLIIFTTFQAYGQVSFEYLNLPIDTFVNDSENGFTEDIITLPNDFNPDFNSFTGFALSTMTDTTTPGFFNQYSVASGSGSSGSQTYAIGFLSDNNSIFFNESTNIQSFDVNNTTYAALSMQDGDAYAKKFGGESGDDPDFFLLTLLFFNNGVGTGDTVIFFMADYRFEDNTQDYIVTDWTTIDLSGVTNPYDQINLSLFSTDFGAFGMNTPNYVAIDNFIVDPVSIKNEELKNVKVYPNPIYDEFNIEVENISDLKLFNSLGQFVLEKRISEKATINLEALAPGIYYLRVESDGKSTIKKIIKN